MGKGSEDHDRAKYSPRLIVKEEMNLAEFPFTLLTRRVSKSQKTIEVTQRVRDRSGRFVKQRWVVTGSDEYGLPLAIDNDVYLALMQVFKENGFRDRKAHFTRYQLLKVMGKIPSKEKYDMIEGALDRLVSVVVKSENAFWDNEAKAHVTKAFHLFESYDLYDERVRIQNNNQPDLPLSNVVMSEFLFNSIKSSYIKNLDISFYFALQIPLTRRLYRFLDKKRYRRSTYEIDLIKLASLLPLQDRYPSQIKRRLERAHEELVDKEYLRDTAYEQERSSRREIIVYTFGQTASSERPELKSESQAPDREDTGVLMQKLVDRKITRAAAQRLVTNYSTKRIEKQIAVFDWLVEKKSSLVKKNPAGFLRKSIEEDYQPPEGYHSHRERKAKKLEEEKMMAQKRAEEEKRERELARIKSYKESLSREERAKLREKAESEVRNSGQFKEEFITDYLIEAKENDIIRQQIGLKRSE